MMLCSGMPFPLEYYIDNVTVLPLPNNAHLPILAALENADYLDELVVPGNLLPYGVDITIGIGVSNDIGVTAYMQGTVCRPHAPVGLYAIADDV